MGFCRFVRGDGAGVSGFADRDCLALSGRASPMRSKSSTYECGVETIGDTWVQFRVQYYIYGLIFLIFDVEMVFLFPWAVAYNELNLFGFVAGFLFIFLLTDALFYAWKKDALDWK